jgi:amidohydrolase
MVKEVLNNPKVDVIFGLHINKNGRTIKYRPEGTMASSDWFKIKNHR